MTNSGLLQLSFNISVFNPYLGVDQFNNQSLQLQMQKAYSGVTYPIAWSAVNISANTLIIYLNYSDPATISQYSQKDTLLVSFKQGVPLLASQANNSANLQNAI